MGSGKHLGLFFIFVFLGGDYSKGGKISKGPAEISRGHVSQVQEGR